MNWEKYARWGLDSFVLLLQFLLFYLYGIIIISKQIVPIIVFAPIIGLTLLLFAHRLLKRKWLR